MEKKIGRPKKDNAIVINFSVRLDAETERTLREYCTKNNITRAQAVRSGLHLLMGSKA